MKPETSFTAARLGSLQMRACTHSYRHNVKAYAVACLSRFDGQRIAPLPSISQFMDVLFWKVEKQILCGIQMNPHTYIIKRCITMSVVYSEIKPYFQQFRFCTTLRPLVHLMAQTRVNSKTTLTSVYNAYSS